MAVKAHSMTRSRRLLLERVAKLLKGAKKAKLEQVMRDLKPKGTRKPQLEQVVRNLKAKGTRKPKLEQVVRDLRAKRAAKARRNGRPNYIPGDLPWSALSLSAKKVLGLEDSCVRR